MRVILQIGGCDGCTVEVNTPWRINAESFFFKSSPTKTVAGGQVAFQVPRSLTPGMYFSVNDPTAIGMNAVPVIAMRYVGMEPGQTVDANQAAGGTQASGCWSGASRLEHMFTAQVDRFPLTTISGEPGTGLRAYLTRAESTAGTPQDTFEGSLGTQDALAVCGDLPVRRKGGPDEASDLLVKRANARRFSKARRVASRSAVRELKSHRERGYTYGGRSLNPCRQVDYSDVYECPATVFKRGRTYGSVYMTVSFTGRRFAVTKAVVALGE